MSDWNMMDHRTTGIMEGGKRNYTNNKNNNNNNNNNNYITTDNAYQVAKLFSVPQRSRMTRYELLETISKICTLALETSQRRLQARSQIKTQIKTQQKDIH